MKTEIKLKIAYFIDWIESSFQLSLMRGVREKACEKNLNLLIFAGGAVNSTKTHEMQRNIIYDFVSRESFDGLIISSGAIGNNLAPGEMETFCSKYLTIPLVSIAESLNQGTSLLVNNSTGYRKILKHLIADHGYRRLAFIKGPAENRDARTRYQTYLEVLEQFNLPFDPQLVVPGQFERESGYHAVRTLLDERKVSFDALVAANDNMAYGAYDALQARGLFIPRDIAVTGFDDQQESLYMNPPLTTVRQPFYILGKTAVDLLYRMIRGEETEKEIQLPTEPVIRESCGCLLPSLKPALTLKPPKAAGGVRTDSLEDEAFITYCQSIIHIDLADEAEILSRLNIRHTLQTLKQAAATNEGTIFLQYLSQTLTSLQLQPDERFTLQKYIDQLRLQTLPYFRSKGKETFIEEIWHQTQILLYEYFIRINNRQHLAVEKQMETFSDLSENIITLTDLDQVSNLLANHLPQSGVCCCYFSLYEKEAQNDPLRGEARLILGYNRQKRQQLEPGGLIFPAREIIPAASLAEQARYTLFVEPVFFGTHLLGLVACDVEMDQGFAFSIIRRMFVNSALKGTIFLQQPSQAEGELRLQYILETLQSTREKLVQSKKMAALGELVAGITHEINTPVGLSVTASSHLELSTRQLAAAFKSNQLKRSELESYIATAEEATSLIQRNLRRAFDLITSFKKIAVDQTSEEKRYFKIKDYISDILASLKPKLKKTNITIQVSCPEELEINSYPGAISQIITNLVINSLIHAFEPDQHGEITITITLQEQRLNIIYHDNGKGIEQKNQDKIFQPFFTTRRARGGSGLGLHLIYTIVTRKLNGQMHCESAPGSGTTFIVSFPDRNP